MIVQSYLSKSVGHSAIDRQHQHLISILSELDQKINQITTNNNGFDCLVIEYARNFFDEFSVHSHDEEEIMRTFHYGNLEKHTKHHDFFIRALKAILVDESDVGIIKANLPFIRSAVFDHIERDDRDFGAHLKQLGCFGMM